MFDKNLYYSSPKEIFNGDFLFNVIMNLIFCFIGFLIFKFNFIAFVLCYVASEAFSCFVIKTKNKIKRGKEEREETFLSGLLSKINEEREKLQEEIKEKKEAEEQEEKEKENLKDRRYSDISELVNGFLEFYDDLSVKSTKELDGIREIKEDFLNIRDGLRKRPEKAYYVKESTYTYTNEFMKLISNYESLDHKERKVYNDRYNDLVSEFHVYLSQIAKEIADRPSEEVDLTLRTLYQELREQNRN